MSDPFPEIKSSHSLVAKYVTKPLWEKLSQAITPTSGFTLAKAIACAVVKDALPQKHARVSIHQRRGISGPHRSRS